jgi:hypothetical protein
MKAWRLNGDIEIFMETWRNTVVFYLKNSKRIEMQYLRFSLSPVHHNNFFMFVQLHLLRNC